MTHEHAEGCSAAIKGSILRSFRDRSLQQGIDEQKAVPLPGKLPGGASSGDTGTDDGDGGAQLRACSGITTE